MNPSELQAARVLLLALHEQADRTPGKRHRRQALRTALACVELIHEVTQPPPVKVARLARAYAPTEWAQTHLADTVMQEAA